MKIAFFIFAGFLRGEGVFSFFGFLEGENGTFRSFEIVCKGRRLFEFWRTRGANSPAWWKRISPAPGPLDAAQVIRWQLQHRQQRPGPPRWRPGTTQDRQSTYHGHILCKTGSLNIRTQQNKYLVAFASAKRPRKNLFLLKMLGKHHVLLAYACMPHADTLLVSSTWTK